MSVIKQCGLVTAFKLGQNEPVTLMDWVSNVDGNMLGKSFTATGSRNSMKGTTTKTRKGTRRKRSAQIRRNWKGVEGPEGDWGAFLAQSSAGATAGASQGADRAPEAP